MYQKSSVLMILCFNLHFSGKAKVTVLRLAAFQMQISQWQSKGDCGKVPL